MLLVMLLNIVGTMACCVGQFFVLPIHFAAFAIAYRKVFPAERIASAAAHRWARSRLRAMPGADDF